MSSILGGNSAATQGMNNAVGISQDMMNQYKGLDLPDIEKMKLYLEQYQSQGQLNPVQEAAVAEHGTGLSGITTDPRLRANYMSALQQLTGLSQTGMTDVDRAAMQDMLRQSAAQQQAQQKSILEQRAARGMGGSGDELAAALQSSQSGANQANANSMKIAAQAMQNRLNALNQSSGLAQSIESTDYGRASESARAQDAINQFNTQLASGTQQRNVGSQNVAQQANLAAKQNLANANVEMSNQQQQYNKELQQQAYQNQLARLAGMSGQAAGLGQLYQNQGIAAANAKKGQMAGIGTLVGGAAGAYFGGPAGAGVGAQLGGAAGSAVG